LITGKFIPERNLPYLDRNFSFYTYGREPYPDEVIVKLSDAFENINVLGLPDKEIFVLELIVKVINN
jgi:hypothetical protein